MFFCPSYIVVPKHAASGQGEDTEKSGTTLFLTQLSVLGVMHPRVCLAILAIGAHYRFVFNLLSSRTTHLFLQDRKLLKLLLIIEINLTF